MLSTIWSSPNTAETLFLIAAIAFFIEAVMILIARVPSRRTPEGTTRPVIYSFTGFFAAVGLVLLALGFLAL